MIWFGVVKPVMYELQKTIVRTGSGHYINPRMMSYTAIVCHRVKQNIWLFQE